MKLTYTWQSLEEILVSKKECAFDTKKSVVRVPMLWSALTSLNISHNFLTYLPSLPPLLRKLMCSDNSLTSLPRLPQTLESLIADHNLLTELPELPEVMRYLNVLDNPIVVDPKSLPLITKLAVPRKVAPSTEVELYPSDLGGEVEEEQAEGEEEQVEEEQVEEEAEEVKPPSPEPTLTLIKPHVEFRGGVVEAWLAIQSTLIMCWVLWATGMTPYSKVDIWF